MPDLGKYAVYVLASYGVALSVIGVLVLASLRGAARSRKQVEEAESRLKGE